MRHTCAEFRDKYMSLALEILLAVPLSQSAVADRHLSGLAKIKVAVDEARKSHKPMVDSVIAGSLHMKVESTRALPIVVLYTEDYGKFPDNELVFDRLGWLESPT